jgi:hypothetical protein
MGIGLSAVPIVGGLYSLRFNSVTERGPDPFPGPH